MKKRIIKAAEGSAAAPNTREEHLPTYISNLLDEVDGLGEGLDAKQRTEINSKIDAMYGLAKEIEEVLAW